mmetsp:Transcript_27058/g.78057  ORF Transcript_27058/g.78057 Transcript_27058/m.78057 type:complete len:452 (+) Transcript_27058:274-1629(+)
MRISVSSSSPLSAASRISMTSSFCSLNSLLLSMVLRVATNPKRPAAMSGALLAKSPSAVFSFRYSSMLFLNQGSLVSAGGAGRISRTGAEEGVDGLPMGSRSLEEKDSFPTLLSYTFSFVAGAGGGVSTTIGAGGGDMGSGIDSGSGLASTTGAFTTFASTTSSTTGKGAGAGSGEGAGLDFAEGLDRGDGLGVGGAVLVLPPPPPNAVPPTKSAATPAPINFLCSASSLDWKSAIKSEKDEPPIAPAVPAFLKGLTAATAFLLAGAAASFLADAGFFAPKEAKGDAPVFFLFLAAKISDRLLANGLTTGVFLITGAGAGAGLALALGTCCRCFATEALDLALVPPTATVPPPEARRLPTSATSCKLTPFLGTDRPEAKGFFVVAFFSAAAAATASSAFFFLASAPPLAAVLAAMTTRIRADHPVAVMVALSPAVSLATYAAHEAFSSAAT